MRTLLFTLSVLLGPSLTLSAEAERPNILYFFVDDMGWGSIGPNGQDARKAKGLPCVRTPNLNRLAAAGVNFSRGYGCPVCSPSRASQQTGFHQGHTFADRNDPDNAKKAMRSDDVTMGDALSAAGYVTGYWGKWGFGGSKSLPNPVIENAQTLPTSHGYKYALAELHHVRAHTFFQPTLWSAPAPAGSIGGLELIPNSMARYRDNANYPAAPALQNHANYPKTGYCDDAYAFAALEFVRSQGQNFNKSGQPFFGLLAVQIPHAPFAEVARLPDWDKAYADDPHFESLAEQSQQWAAMVTRIDGHFGNILAALEDPNNDGDTSDSVADNTLVIFQSDNGGPAGRNNVQLDANGGLRGNKGSVYEGGIRVPLVMRWPTKITAGSTLKAGSTTDRVVDITDLLPTFCDLAGATTPVGIDGVSIAPTLLSTGHQRTRDFIIHEAGGSSSIIRGRHKLIRSVPKRSKKPTKPTLELYDLESDHAEQHNIVQQHPELVETLEALLLGERVTEPKGFANTYHHWTAKEDGALSDADNWSDYNYSNAGITYMTDAGTPQPSWIARMENSGFRPNNAKTFVSRKFLGLEIKGNSKTKALQSLVLAPKVHLSGLNEIRLSPYSSLTVNGGPVITRRWVDISPNASLKGMGSIIGTVYNKGAVLVTQSFLTINGDFYQSVGAMLDLNVSDTEKVPFNVDGTATLSGKLAITARNIFKLKANIPFTILTADDVNGKFSNPDDTVIASNGDRFTIHYSDSAVTLTLK